MIRQPAEMTINDNVWQCTPCPKLFALSIKIKDKSLKIEAFYK